MESGVYLTRQPISPSSLIQNDIWKIPESVQDLKEI